MCFQSFEVNNHRKATRGAPLPAPSPALPTVPTLCLSYFTSDVINGTEHILCHRLFRSGNRGAVEYDRRKQSLRECPPQVGNVEAVHQAWNSWVLARKHGGKRDRKSGVHTRGVSLNANKQVREFPQTLISVCTVERMLNMHGVFMCVRDWANSEIGADTVKTIFPLITDKGWHGDLCNFSKCSWFSVIWNEYFIT